MKYHYYYQTRENKSRDAWINARDRNEVYAILKKSGIRPYKVIGRNPFAWKRWTAIAVLSVVCIGLSILLLQLKLKNEEIVSEPRTPIYGDASAIQRHESMNWSDVFDDAGEQYLALFAEPGKKVPNIIASPAVLEKCLDHKIVFLPEDSEEVRKMKRIVNGMKDELNDYIAAGGNARLYIERLLSRQRVEEKIANSMQSEFIALKKQIKSDNHEDILKKWNEKNELLREMGFRTELVPDEIEPQYSGQE